MKTAEKTKSLDKQHIIRGWLVNEKTNPLVIEKAEGMYFWDTEGINADGSYKEEDNYLMVRKQFYDRYGRQIPDNTFRLFMRMITGRSSVLNTSS